MNRIVFLFFSFFFTITILSAQDNQAVIILRLKYNSHGMVGFGGSLRLRNIATNEILESRSKMGFNTHVVISNLPFGTYAVDELELIAGSNKIFVRDSLVFNQIKIDESKIYYLGNYMTKKIPPLLKYNIEITKQDTENANKIYGEVKEKVTNLQGLKINYDIQLFKKDSTIIQLR